MTNPAEMMPRALSMAEIAAADMTEAGIDPIAIAIAMAGEARNQVWRNSPTPEAYVRIMAIVARHLAGEKEQAK